MMTTVDSDIFSSHISAFIFFNFLHACRYHHRSQRKNAGITSRTCLKQQEWVEVVVCKQQEREWMLL